MHEVKKENPYMYSEYCSKSYHKMIVYNIEWCYDIIGCSGEYNKL